MVDNLKSSGIELLVGCLPGLREHHIRTSSVYELLRQIAKERIDYEYSEDSIWKLKLGDIGSLQLPFTEMGAITSVDLFGLDELIIFSYYLANRDKYHRVVDIGANIGLHSIVMSKCGYQVTSFEPDPGHYELLRSNIALNKCSNVEIVQAAISSENGIAQFTRVIGNTTGSHLSGAKADPYGEIEYIDVRTVSAKEAVNGADLLKIDAEGHEAEILRSIPDAQWSGTDAFVEVGSAKNASEIFSLFHGGEVNLFSQKMGWNRVNRIEEIPSSYKEGSLFISANREMIWNG
jgi:FkbM family methyltransferase